MSGEEPGAQAAATQSPALAAARTERAGLHQCMGALEEAVASPAVGREREWVREVHNRLVELGAAFERHIAVTEGPGGLFEEVHKAAPRLTHGVERLADDHREIRAAIGRALDAIRDRADMLPETPGDGREAVLDLLDQLMRHRQLGADLIYEAYQVDMGAGD